jgi:putative membrane protein insertion efficiency factor
MTRRAPVRRALLAVVGFYSRAISPALPPRCRFHPTCSAYAAEAIERHGAARGSWLALRRILKCAPWHPGGVDLVPAAPGTREPARASSTAVPAPAAPDPARATPPAPSRANEETSVA